MENVCCYSADEVEGNDTSCIPDPETLSSFRFSQSDYKDLEGK